MTSGKKMFNIYYSESAFELQTRMPAVSGATMMIARETIKMFNADSGVPWRMAVQQRHEEQVCRHAHSRRMMATRVIKILHVDYTALLWRVKCTEEMSRPYPEIGML